MSKRPIKLPPLKSGRRVRWTFEVSADVDRKKSARTSSASKKTKPGRRPKRRTSKPGTPREESTSSIPVRAQTPALKTVAVATTPAASDSAPRVTSARQAKPRSTVSRGTSRSRVIALAAFATLIIAVLALPRRSGLVPASAETVKSEVLDATAQPAVGAPSAASSSAFAATAPSTAKPDATTHPQGEPVKKTPAEPAQNFVAPSSGPAALPPAVVPHDSAPSESPRISSAPTATVAPATPPASATETTAPSQVTITGCLEGRANDERFRLTDTEGGNAPKARSWRTGFLKKRSASVDLVGAPDLGALQKQAGRRVAVTGVQTNRELKVASVRVVSPSCN